MGALRRNSLDAIDDRVIPRISVEQYFSQLASWFGASAAELHQIFPNLQSFSIAGSGFMNLDTLFADGFEGASEC